MPWACSGHLSLLRVFQSITQLHISSIVLGVCPRSLLRSLRSVEHMRPLGIYIAESAADLGLMLLETHMKYTSPAASSRIGDCISPRICTQAQTPVQVTSSAKRRRQPGSTSLAQTPDGSFRDLMQNAADLLHQCGFSHIPAVRVPSVSELRNLCCDVCWHRREPASQVSYRGSATVLQLGLMLKCLLGYRWGMPAHTCSRGRALCSCSILRSGQSGTSSLRSCVAASWCHVQSWSWR